MDGIPPALPTDSEDIAWALETAEALWRRGERVDAVVWVRRAAQAAGEGEDAKRAVALAKYAAELGDWIGSHTIGGESGETHAHSHAQSERAIEAVDALLGSSGEPEADAISLSEIEVVSAQDFEAGLGPSKGYEPKISTAHHSDPEVMTVSLQAPDVEVVDDEVEEFPEEEPTPVIAHPRSPVPEAGVPSAAEAHAGMLDPWAEGDGARRSVAKVSSEVPTRRFDEEEVVTSAKRNAAQPPRAEAPSESIPRAPKPPRLHAPTPFRARPELRAEEPDTTTYKQINARSLRADRPSVPPPSQAKPPLPKPPLLRSRAPSLDKPPARPEPLQRVPSPPESIPPTKPGAARRPTPPPPKEKSLPPSLDLLEMVDSVSVADEPPLSDEPPPPFPSTPASARPTAPPPSSMPRDAFPSVVTTAPATGPTLDLGEVEALADLPDDARDAFARAATMHTIVTDEEVSRFALALVVEGEIDVSATIVDAPALRLPRKSILRSRGSIVPGVSLRLVCASPTALVATWTDAAVAAAFRTCPWVEDDLLAVTDRVQAKAGVTMGPLGERFDQSLREHLTSKLTVRNLSPGEVLVAQGKPTPIAIVGIGEIVLTTNGRRGETLGPGEFVFPSETLAHAPAPATAAAGAAGAVVLYGERSVAQELLMGFPPLLEVLATL